MSLPTWEIVIIAIISVTIAGVALYMFFRCWKSMVSLSQDASKRQQSPRATHPPGKRGNQPPEVYGVPYRPPNVTEPQPLDPAKLQGIVMEGKSDLHPYYLEKKEYATEADRAISNGDHRVVWQPDGILIESEFLPDTRHVYSIGGSANSPISPYNISPKPRKMVHINYDKGEDGAPEIKCITTEQSDAESDSSGSDFCIDEVFEMPQKKSRDVVDAGHVTLADNTNRRVLHAPRDTWIEFEDDAKEMQPAILPISTCSTA